MNEKDTSEWSTLTSFTTLISSPILEYPDNQSYGIKFYDHHKWNNIQGAESYRVELTNSQTFLSITQFFVGITDTFVVIPPLKHNTRYCWRVFAIKGNDTVQLKCHFLLQLKLEKRSNLFCNNQIEELRKRKPME